ncbi:50S ribosomal protein L11 methyltransferase [Butyrivibrio sp. MC2013]|uniref:50S ribosomal protein L11 methyltransferase n=1 Tax=Butyrivibrio sp. MC2013 TaxID=1280686 RepID=UPI00047A73DB
MRWMRFRIRTNEEAEDVIISSMMDIGLAGAQIEDKVPLTAAEKEQMFVDVVPQEEDDGIAYLNFFAQLSDDGTLKVSLPLDDEEYSADGRGDVSYQLENEGGREVVKTPEELKEDIFRVLSEIRNYCDIGDGTLSVDITEDIDWMNNWKQYFHKFIVDDVLIIPSWEEPSAEDLEKADKIFHIDPGTAFGTGLHESTQLCIHQLSKYVTPGCEVLDVGTGSGVLSILALMYGAGHCVGTDLDKGAIPAIAENLKNNGFSEDDLKLIIGNIIDDKAVQDEVGYEKYDLVLANILPVVLVPLAPVIGQFMKPGAVFVTSGIMNEKGEEVAAAHRAAGFTDIHMDHQGDWVSVISRKPED